MRHKEARYLFFDFYVLNDLWFNTVGYHTEYGYPLRVILPARKCERIEEAFFLTVEKMKSNIIFYLERTCRHEARYWREMGDPYNYFNEDDEEWDKRHKKVFRVRFKRNCELYGRAIKKWSLEEIHWIFDRKWCASDYGGKRWAKATELLIKLKASKTVKDDVFYIDQILDLQHNTGFILDKTPFRALSDLSLWTNKWQNALDVRARATPLQMLQWCTRPTKRLYLGNLNYLPGQTLSR